jgi:hypothetical protein
MEVRIQRGAELRHFPVLVNRNRDVLGAYGTVFADRRSSLAYVAVPECQDNASALTGILEVIAEVEPLLIPGYAGKKAWLRSHEFAFAEELQIDQEIATRTTETEQFVRSKQAERSQVAVTFEPLRKILHATEDPSVDKNERLSTNVRAVLEYLGFEVIDIDEKMRSAIRKEDYWVIDGTFLAITEVTATRQKNPKTKEYNDLLGRMSTVYKRRDLVPDTETVTGLLVVNYDLDTHPFKRPKLYGGMDQEWVDAAAEQGIGLLSTVELHRIAIAVKGGVLSKEAARELIKQMGRIEYQPRTQS